MIHGNRCAKIIQRNFRKYRFLDNHMIRKNKNRIVPRNYKAIMIQTQMRRYLGAKRFNNLKILYNKCVTKIQAAFRGFRYRLHQKRHKSARIITRFFRYLGTITYQDYRFTVIELKKLFRRKVLASIQIQRIIRGFLGRRRVRNKKYLIIYCRSMAQKIQKNYRAYLVIKHTPPKKIPPGEDWALKQCGKRLATMIYEFYVDKEKRKKLISIMNSSAPVVQGLIRGYLGRTGSHKMKFLRHALRTWCKPQYASEFFRKYLERIFGIQKWKTT